MCCSSPECQNISTRTTFFFIHLHIAFAIPMSTTCAPLITKVKNKTNKKYNQSQQNNVITDIRDLFS